MDHVQTLCQSICAATGTTAARTRFMDENWYRFIFNSSDKKVQKHISQTVKTHKRSGVIAMKILVSKTTQADAEAVRLKKMICKILISKTLTTMHQR